MIFININYSSINNLLYRVGTFLFEILKINIDIRRDAFIGLTGLMVAIIIFIAEAISNENYEIRKRVFLSKTKIIQNMLFCIVIFVTIFISSFIECSSNDAVQPIEEAKISQSKNNYLQNDIVFTVVQSAINIMVLVFAYNTYNVFKISVKLKIDKGYLNEEIDNYLENRSIEIEKAATIESLKNIKKLQDEFEAYIQDNYPIFSKISDNNFNEKGYKPLYITNSGIIKKYDYMKLNSIIDEFRNFEHNKSIESEKVNIAISKDKSILIFSKQIGDKLDKGSIGGYCLEEYSKYFNDFSDLILFEENSRYIKDEIKEVQKGLFAEANEFHESEQFDNNNRLLNYCDYIYKNDLNGVKTYYISQLFETAKYVYNEQYKNYKYTIFLNNVSTLAFRYNNLEDYQLVKKLALDMYCKQLEIADDTKKVIYNFASSSFRHDYFLIKKDADIKYYEILMSFLLNFIICNIKLKKIEELSVLFENIWLDHHYSYDNDNFSEKDILNFQFSICIIKCLVILLEKNDELDKNVENIKKVINWVKTNFISNLDAWTIILNFKKYYNKPSMIQSAYGNLDLSLTDHKYRSTISAWNISKVKILKELLYSFKINWTFTANIDYDEISKDDKMFLSDLLNMLSSSEQTVYESKLKLSSLNSNVFEILQQAIDIATKKEDNYIRESKLASKKLENFEKIIKEEAFKKSKLEDYLELYGKVENINQKISFVCGTNDLIHRNLFLKDTGGYESVAKQFGNIFNPAKEKEFVNKIDHISKLSSSNINDYLAKLDNIEEYLLIADRFNCRYNIGYDKECIKINGKELNFIQISNIDYIYLIEKKQLPKLQYCKFSDEYDSSKIYNKSLYYELNDCSNDEDLRNKIIESSPWLKEKGSIVEQNEYLKKYCRIKLFMAIRFVNIKNSSALKFKISDDEEL